MTAAIVIIVVMVVKLNQKSAENCYPHAAVAADAERCSEVGRYDKLGERSNIHGHSACRAKLFSRSLLGTSC